jgi:hypothetical protein
MLRINSRFILIVWTIGIIISVNDRCGYSNFTPVKYFSELQTISDETTHGVSEGKSAPDPPVLLTPADGSLDINTRPNLTWEFSAGVTAWHLQVSLNESFSPTIYDDTTVTKNSRQVGALPCNRTVYWRVKAKNTDGWSSYSSTFSFRTLEAPQHATISIRSSFTSPGSRPSGLTWDGRNLWMVDNLRNLYKMDAAGNVITSFPVLGFSDDRGLTWDGTGLWIVVGVHNYKLDTLGNVIDTLDVQHWWHSGLDWDGKYWWFGNYNLSTLHKHDRDGIEILNFELNEIFGHPTGLAYDGINLWIGTSSEGFTDDIFKYSTIGAYVYEFDLGTIGISPPSGSYAALAWDGQSLWYTTDDQFTIYRLNVPYYHQVPAVPSLLLPSDGNVNVDITPILNWSESLNAEKYDLQVATDISFNDLVFDISGISSTTHQLEALEKMTTYYWHVRATNPVGASLFSSTRSFTTRGMEFPEIVSATYGNGTITLAWNPVDEPDLAQYNIYRDLYSPATTLLDSIVTPSATDTVYVDANITAGMDYHYRITVKDSYGNESGFSNEVHCVVPFDLHSDSLALVALYESTDGVNWTDHSNWLTGNVSTWFGITVSANRVVFINLDHNNLIGTIPLSLCQLDQLQELILSDNQLSGTIPSETGNLVNLQRIDLKMNQLSGEIPPEMGGLSNLQELLLDGNQFSGSIPDAIGNLSGLTHLNLSSNQLEGPFPASLGNLTALKDLQLFSNNLGGQIPAEISNLTNLTSLWLEHNAFTDPVPVEWDKLTPLEVLHLNDNQLENLPDLSALASLHELKIDSNRFTFEDIEPNIDVPDLTFIYSPQDSVGTEKMATVAIDSSYTVTVTVGGLNNIYQWYLNGTLISGADANEYTLDPVKKEDYGSYHCLITNSVVPLLTLISRPIHVIPADNYIIVTDELPYVDDFESGAEYWTTGGTNSSWQLGTPSGATINTPSSGTNAWMTNLSGNYNPNETSWVTSPLFDLSLLSNPAIEMKVWWDCEGTYDGATLQYSEDTAKTWHTLQKATNYLWYNSSYVIGLLNTTGSGKGWSGDGTFGTGSNEWVTVRASIAGPVNYDGLTFRILFVSNGVYENDGFAFDDVKIYNDASAGIKPVNENRGIRIYPNPFRERALVEFENPSHECFRLTLMDISGKIVRIVNDITAQSIEVGRESLSAGLYIIELRGSKTYRTLILIE